tara:strand:- start:827 stop:2092 length:1266 start_codon:yes stop_codon:yes gene_type:complete
MAYVAVAGIAPQYENYAEWWIKCYAQGTTTPVSMALDGAGSTTVAKLQLDAAGFIKTAGNARVIPYLGEAYDAWLIPTEEDADDNDLTSAIQVADNIIPQDFATNAADIATNAANIATNAANIATNVTNIAANVTNKAALSGAAFTGAVSTITSNTPLSDAAATLTAAQLIGGEFTITPTVARIQTTDTAANIIAAMTDSVDDSSFNIAMINLAAFDVTIASGSGVTLVGNMLVNDGSATFKVRRLTSSTVSVTRLNSASASGGINIGTPVATTSGTAIDLTGIPLGVKRVTIFFDGVSTNGTARIMTQLGAGSIETSGYVGSATYAGGTNNCGGASHSADFKMVGTQAASALINGSYVYSKSSGNQWVLSGSASSASATSYNHTSSGTKTLTGELDRIRLSTSGGTDAFDAGAINISWEF